MLLRLASFVLVVAIAGCAGVKTDNSSMNDPQGAADLAGGGGGGDVDLAGGGGDLLSSGGPDLIRLKAYGEGCAADGECTSGLCKPLNPDGAKICVASCKAQADCAKYDATYCAPKSIGATEGYCVAISPFHCSSCGSDGECGGLTERCMQAPNDIAAACHIDCALSGAAACPTDYTCADVQDGATARKLCVPKAQICLDALGGFCDRISTPQACSRINNAGTCTGQRNCLLSKRYDRCNAQAPQFKMSCSDLDPAGCKLAFSPNAATTKQHCGMCGKSCAANEDCCGGVCKPLDTVQNCGVCNRTCAAGSGCCTGACTSLATPQNCGACGNVCPGLGLTTNDVTCADPATKKCGMTCRGENYDVDNNAANGCERLHPTPPGHSQGTAQGRGNKPCTDGASTDTFNHPLYSDSRQHDNPTVAFFSGTVGSAPDYWHVHADGGLFCVNDFDVTFRTAGGGGTACYTCTIITNKVTKSVTVTGAGSASMASGSGSYSENSEIYFKIEKSCSLPVQEAVTYTVSYHL